MSPKKKLTIIKFSNPIQEPSRCTEGALGGALILLLAGRLIEEQPFRKIFLSFFLLLVIMGVVSHVINGIRPTFCMSPSEKILNHRLAQRQRRRKKKND